jgi:hypothetical protein
MAKIIGRKGCPHCGFESAHVKQSEGKHPYHHCPECGIMTTARNGQQARLITANMRPEPDYTSPEYGGPAGKPAAGEVPTPPAAADPIIVPGVVVKNGIKKPAKDPAPVPAGGNGLWSQLVKGSPQQ